MTGTGFTIKRSIADKTRQKAKMTKSTEETPHGLYDPQLVTFTPRPRSVCDRSSVARGASVVDPLRVGECGGCRDGDGIGLGCTWLEPPRAVPPAFMASSVMVLTSLFTVRLELRQDETTVDRPPMWLLPTESDGEYEPMPGVDMGVGCGVSSSATTVGRWPSSSAMRGPTWSGGGIILGSDPGPK